MPQSQSGIQSFVNRELPPGVAGDWAGANIRASVTIGPWAFVAPPSGTTVGAIGWGNPATGICSNYFQPSSFPGFIHREQQAMGLQTSGAGILTNVAATQVLSGYPVTALSQGSFWGLFQGGASAGNSVYANPTTGALIAAASGSGVNASNTSITTSGTGNTTMTLVGSTTGTVAIGQIVVSGALPPGTYIVSGSGTAWVIGNLDGTPLPTITTTAAAFYGQQPVQWLCMESVPALASITATLAASAGAGPFGVLTVSAVGSGVIYPGQWIQSSGTVPVPLTANIQIVQQLTGSAGSTGTYLVSNTIAVASGQTFTTYNGQMAKISSWAPL
ncbi:MAG: hypothetical protein WBW93_16415 [Steroidobacteraceae bacterium]